MDSFLYLPLAVEKKGSQTRHFLRQLLQLLMYMTMYKDFVRPHLDYGDIIYDEAYNETFHQKLESIQYMPV